MKKRIKLKDIASYSKGLQINGENLISDGLYDYINGGVNPSGKWNEANCTANTITISEGGNSCGYVNFMSKPFWCGAHCYYLYDTIDNSQYLYYALKSQQERIMRLRSGACMPNIKKNDLGNFEFTFDSDINEQEKIVSVLSKAKTLISKQKQQLVKLDELVKSRFIELFGEYDLTHPQESWVTIKEIGTVVGGATPKTDHDEYWGGSYRWITPAELEADSGYIYDSVRKLTKAGVESCSLQEMPVGTVILSSRAPIGKVAIAGKTFYCNQGFKNIICKEEIIPRYLYTILLLNVEYLNSLGRGATFKEISKGIVENIRVPVPPIDLQNQFAAFVEQVDKSKLYDEMEVVA